MGFNLEALGYGPFFAEQLEHDAAGDCRGAAAVPARVAAEHRGAYEVWAEAGVGPAQLAGRLTHELADEGLPGVGDWVVLRGPPEPGGTAIIVEVLARRTVFTRGAAGRQARGQVIAANVDLVFAVCGLDSDYNLRRLERYLARIWASGAQPVVILNKADLCDDAEARRAEVEACSPGVSVYLTSARGGTGLDAIRTLVQPGLTAAFVGSSGVGKSTMINALIGEEQLATGAVRARDGRGCHVTSHRQLVVLPGGGLLLDTPGMRELQLADEEGLDAAFPEIEELAARCRFRDCSHDAEPGCAVTEAVADGRLPAERLEHYQQLGREARAYELRHNEHLRRKAERVWGQLHDEVARMRRWKGSD